MTKLGADPSSHSLALRSLLCFAVGLTIAQGGRREPTRRSAAALFSAIDCVVFFSKRHTTQSPDRSRTFTIVVSSFFCLPKSHQVVRNNTSSSYTDHTNTSAAQSSSCRQHPAIGSASSNGLVVCWRVLTVMITCDASCARMRTCLWATREKYSICCHISGVVARATVQRSRIIRDKNWKKKWI